jgi:hypothetical protein
LGQRNPRARLTFVTRRASRDRRAGRCST